MPARKRGPKPTLRKAARVSVLLEGRQLRRVDAYAKRNAIDRSAALRELVNFGLSAAEIDAATSPAVAECVRRAGRK